MLLKILIDRNIDHHAVRATAATQSKLVTWGDSVVMADIVGVHGVDLPSGNWLREQVRALPTVARLAREGKLECFTSFDLNFERIQVAEPMRAHPSYLLYDIELEWVKPAIVRSYFEGTTDFREATSGKSQERWCNEFLLKLSQTQANRFADDMPNLPKITRRSLRNLARFRALSEGLTREQVRDAFHLWTAEVNGLDYMLTVDKKFINVMTQSKKTQLATIPIAPVQLLEKMSVDEYDPLPLADGDFHSYF